jgi:hypothetical protein
MSIGTDTKSYAAGNDFWLHLHLVLIKEIGVRLNITTHDDRRNLAKRFSDEGMSLLTRVLPLLYKDVLQVLEGETSFIKETNFSSRCFGTVLKEVEGIFVIVPKLFSGIIARCVVFDEDETRKRDAQALAALSQICNLYKKLELRADRRTALSQIESFVKVDSSLPDPERPFPIRGVGRVPLNAKILVNAAEILDKVVGSADLGDITPTVGKGQVFPKLEKWEEYDEIPYSDPVEEEYDSGEYFVSSPLHRAEGKLVAWEVSALHALSNIRTDGEGKTTKQSSHIADTPRDVAGCELRGVSGTLRKIGADILRTQCDKLSMVPKTAEEQRLISLQNSIRLRLQSGQRHVLQSLLERHPLTKGHVNFEDQTVNQRLALESSVSRKNATIDLKEASDRNSLSLVRALLPTHVMRKLEATRAKYCFIPVHQLVFTGDRAQMSDKELRELDHYVEKLLNSVPNLRGEPYGTGVYKPYLCKTACTTGVSYRSISPYAQLRNTGGFLLEYRKFAPMGSANCFVLEAMVFWALAVSTILCESGKTLRECAQLVYVYGDDLIIPVEYLDAFTEVLEGCGLVVNRSKTFSKSFFRESCGVDAYRGVVVTPLRIHNLPPQGVSDVEAIISYMEYAEQFESVGLHETAMIMRDCVENLIGFLPGRTPSDPWLGWVQSKLVRLDPKDEKIRLESERRAVCKFEAGSPIFACCSACACAPTSVWTPAGNLIEPRRMELFEIQDMPCRSFVQGLQTYVWTIQGTTTTPGEDEFSDDSAYYRCVAERLSRRTSPNNVNHEERVRGRTLLMQDGTFLSVLHPWLSRSRYSHKQGLSANPQGNMRSFTPRNAIKLRKRWLTVA